MGMDFDYIEQIRLQLALEDAVTRHETLAQQARDSTLPKQVKAEARERADGYRALLNKVMGLT